LTVVGWSAGYEPVIGPCPLVFDGRFLPLRWDIERLLHWRVWFRELVVDAGCRWDLAIDTADAIDGVEVLAVDALVLRAVSA